MFCPVSLLEIGLNIKTVLMDFKKEDYYGFNY